jgi:colanic acid/amylovoran biosynthesis glycosyltransferase
MKRHYSKVVVAHSVPIWLPQTENWIYQQVKNLPGDIESHVVCKRVESLEQFPLERLNALSGCSRPREIWNRALKWLGLRNYWGILVDVVKEQEVCLLHSHFGNVGWENLTATRKLGLKHVVTFYGHDVGRLPQTDPRWHQRYADLFRTVDRVLCEGNYMASSIEKLGCPAEKIRVQHLGVEVDTIPFTPRRWRPGEPLRVLIAASFREKKGIPFGLEALSRVREWCPLEVTIIGDSGSVERFKAEKRKILSTIEKNSMSDCVRMLGYQPLEVFHSEAAQHHVFLSPSVTAADGDTEGGAPVSLIEMAASGMPIVSSRHCDISEIVQDGQTGLLAEERDVDGLVEHFRWLLANSDSWAAMLDAGRKRIEKEYDVRKQGVRLGEIYRELIEEKGVNC